MEELLEWNKSSWQNKKDFTNQLPIYTNREKLNLVKNEIKTSKPLVLSADIDNLKDKLANIENGKTFILQGGDCAESFRDFSELSILNTINTLRDMVRIIGNSLQKEIVTIGRIAGQFAKPRSNPTETKDNITLLSYRGDIINQIDFNEKSREPNPELMKKAYLQSIETLKIIKNQNIDNFYISHEALLLDYEECFVKNNYLLSTHFPWIGDRTRKIDSPHIEFLRGIKNPIGIKCGPNLNKDELIQIINTLNPNNEKGKITLITRFGNNKIEEFFPKLIDIIKLNKLNVVWSCDPMHGNTKIIECNIKTRYLLDIVGEIEKFFKICKNNNIIAGGLHLEMTGDDVSECIYNNGDKLDVKNYKTLCDPRLSRQQSLYLATSILKFF